MDLVKIRMVTGEDAAALLAIYRPYVEKTAITFEYAVPTEAEFRERIEHILQKYPYIVAIKEGRILGYAYASAFKGRAAYDWAVETSIYVDESSRGLGLGKKLYEVLESLLKAQNIINVNACIAYPNPSSVIFHEKLGYKKVAHFSKCGFKSGKWWDIIWMEKMLGEHPNQPNPVIPVYQLECEVLERLISS